MNASQLTTLSNMIKQKQVHVETIMENMVYDDAFLKNSDITDNDFQILHYMNEYDIFNNVFIILAWFILDHSISQSDVFGIFNVIVYEYKCKEKELLSLLNEYIRNDIFGCNVELLCQFLQVSRNMNVLCTKGHKQLAHTLFMTLDFENIDECMMFIDFLECQYHYLGDCTDEIILWMQVFYNHVALHDRLVKMLGLISHNNPGHVDIHLIRLKMSKLIRI